MKVIKILSLINLNKKHIYAIKLADLNEIRNLKLINIKKYQKYTSSIKKRVNRLYNN